MTIAGGCGVSTTVAASAQHNGATPVQFWLINWAPRFPNIDRSLCLAALCEIIQIAAVRYLSMAL